MNIYRQEKCDYCTNLDIKKKNRQIGNNFTEMYLEIKFCLKTLKKTDLYICFTSLKDLIS